MQLRPYQETFVTTLARSLTQHQAVIGQLATGGGKTICFSAITSRYLAKSGKRVLILVHRKELLEQTRKTLHRAYGINALPITAGMKSIPPAPVYVGMVESTYRRADWLRDVGLVIIDEAHIDSFAKMHEVFAEQLRIGFTATPLSANLRRPLKTHFENIVCGIDIPDLIAQGSLCQCITFAPLGGVDRMSLKTKGADFDEQVMGDEFSKAQHVMNTVKAYEEHAKGKKTIVFNVTIDHSTRVCEQFNQSGYTAMHLDGYLDAPERAKVLQWFNSTPDAILCNVGVATTGFDVPDIECVIVNRATQSLPLWLQMCGRGSRPAPGKTFFTVLDMGCNAVNLGEWSQPRDWDYIFHNPPKKRDKVGAAPVKNCPNCEAIIAVASRTCLYCGHELPPPPVEQDPAMRTLIQITQGVNVKDLVERNQHMKQYATFFQIADHIVRAAKRTYKEMSDEVADILLTQYHLKGKEWCKEVGKRYNQWHQERAKETLFNKIKEQYPDYATTAS